MKENCVEFEGLKKDNELLQSLKRLNDLIVANQENQNKIILQ